MIGIMHPMVRRLSGRILSVMRRERRETRRQMWHQVLRPAMRNADGLQTVAAFPPTPFQ